MTKRDAFGLVLAVVGMATASLPWTHPWFAADVGEAPAGVQPVLAAALPPLVPAWVYDRPLDRYGALQFDLDIQRQTLAEWSAEEDVRTAARGLLDNYLPHLMRGWKGTRYSYSGTSQQPGKGKIACGYYVSTVLRHAGFDVDRVGLARQPAEQILRTLVPDEQIRRFSWASRSTVVGHVIDRGPGVYIVGLDTHVGFLVNEADQVTFCHSTQRDNIGVICEDAVTSPSLKSRYTVVGALRHEAMLDAWLAGDALPTARKGHAQPLFDMIASAELPSGVQPN